MEPVTQGERLAIDFAGLDAKRRSLCRRLTEDPRDALAWTLLARVEQCRGELGTARLCAEAAVSLAPRDARTRLTRAEVLAASPPWADRGCHELLELAGASGPGGWWGWRARTLLQALAP